MGLKDDQSIVSESFAFIIDKRLLSRTNCFAHKFWSDKNQRSWILILACLLDSSIQLVNTNLVLPNSSATKILLGFNQFLELKGWKNLELFWVRIARKTKFWLSIDKWSFPVRDLKINLLNTPSFEHSFGFFQPKATFSKHFVLAVSELPFGLPLSF